MNELRQFLVAALLFAGVGVELPLLRRLVADARRL